MSDTGERRRSGFPTGVVAAAFFMAGLVALLVFLRNDGGGPSILPLDDVDMEAFEARIRGRLEPIELRPASSLRVRGRDVVWRDESGRAMLASPALSFAISLGAASRGDILIHDGVIERVDLMLVRGAGGSWNYDRVVEGILAASGGRDGGGGASASVRLRNIVVRDGAVRIRFPDAAYRATELRVALSGAELSGPGVPDPVFRIPTASALLHLPDTADGTIERPVTLEQARLRIVDGALAFQVESGTFGSSTFAAAEGVWDPTLGGLGLDAVVTVTDGRLADVPWLPGEVPEGTRGSFVLRVEPAGPAGTSLAVSDASLTAPGSAVTGSVRVLLTESGVQVREVEARVDPLALDLVEAFTGPLPYSGDLRGTIRGTGGEIRFDLDASLATTPGGERFLTEVAGRVAFTDAGMTIRSVTAGLDRVPLEALRAIAPGLPLAGPITGSVTLEGAPSDAPFRLDIRLEAGGGIVALAGTVDLRGAVPRYDLTGRLIGVELRRVLQPAVPPAQIHASFALEGAGTDPATAVARVALNGTFTGWESQRGDTIAVQASVDRGLLRTEAARLRLGPIELAAVGDWRFAGGTGGAIRYDLEVASLEPLGPYLPANAAGQRRFARGRLSAEGTLTGTLDTPTLAGSVEASEFRFGEWAASALSGEYDVALGPGLPRIDARFAGRDLRSPGGDFESASTTIDFTRPEFQIAVAAEQLGGGVIEIEAGGLIEETGQRQILLRHAEVDLGEERWRLPAVAEIAWTTGGAVVVDELRLEQVDGPGLVRVDGVAAPWDAMDLAVEIRRLPSGEVIAFTGSPLDVTGFLSLEGTVRGPAGSPELAFDLALEEGSLQDVAVRSLAAQLRYSDGVLHLEGAGLLGDSARIEIEGSAPATLALGLPPSFDLVEDGALDLRLTTAAFPLATLDPGIAMIRDIAGRLDADVRVGGTPDQPVLGGRVQVADGAFTVPLLDRRYEEIRGLAVLDGRILRVDSLVARSDGTARVTGQMVFDQLTDPGLDLVAELDGFRAQEVEGDEGAAAWGTMRLRGSLQAPRLTGQIALDDGTLDMAPFQTGPQFSEAFTGADDPFEPLLGPDIDAGDPAAGRLVVSGLRVTAREDLWFATEEARAQLSGTLVVNKQGDDLTIQGTLQGNQGTFTLRVGPRLTRRFDIVDASIRFFGSPEPNPGLDITASRLVRTAEGRDVDVRIRVSGTLQNPSLALASAEGASIPESELFCFVALARPCSELTAFGGGTALSDLFALYGVTDILASQLDLGLDYFHIGMRPGQGLVEGLYLTLGEEFDEPLENLFLLAEIPLGEMTELWEASLEWRIDRQWTLELAYEPASIMRNTATGRTLPPELLDSGHQFLLAIRRRWTY